MDEVEKVFRKIDANGDGKISLSELGAILNALGSTTSPDEVKRIMLEVDTDGDGFIDLKEFADFYCPRGGEDGDSKELREAFDLYDKDKNGKITAAELHSVMKSLGEKCSLKDCRRMIRLNWNQRLILWSDVEEICGLRWVIAKDHTEL
ncbi:hypothetical protein K7X08_019623 [Anisodus acutangulus]|uniref:EF-hand domain-containing protein n=1 Tax=Anisodus acutangulus TaxID=402998 RepID=A0A9Q1MRW7_9SOLA|nr:hypothetical protein K7X08_019623 [Anisodus acutangulus]